MQNLSRRQYWIFDLDGTLTRPVHDFAAIRRNLDIPEGEDILRFIAAQPDNLRKHLSHRLAEIEMELAGRAEANPGVPELLRWLHSRGCVLAILTRNQRECVNVSLQRLGVASLFCRQAIIACDDAPPKPDPGGIQRLLEHWQTGPENCVMVGDFLYDLQVGSEAGMTTLHYAAHRQERWPQLTDYLVEDFSVLLKSLSG